MSAGKVWAGYDEVTPKDRLFLNSVMVQCAREQNFEMAAIFRAATYWESFPDSYTSEQVAAAKELHIAGRDGFGSDVWADAMRVVRDIMNRPVTQ